MKEKRFSWRLAVTLAFCIILFAAAPAAAADGEVYINDTSGTPYTSIQAAADAASPGDTILVSPGTYIERVEVNTENLTLKSIDGAEKTIIDGHVPGYSGKCISFFTSQISIEGFTLISDYNGIYSGKVFSNGVITIKNNIIDTAGDGISFRTFSEFAATDTKLKITGNDITTGDGETAIFLDMSLVGCRVEISENHISDSSRGIRLECEIGYDGTEAKPKYASEVVINNNTIDTADVDSTTSPGYWDGAILVTQLYYGSVHITENRLIDCRQGILVGTGGRAGAETDVLVKGNTITLSDSAPDWEYGSAIHVDSPERVTRIEGNTIKGNTQYKYDYGIYLGYIGEYVDEFEAYILNNEVAFCLKGLSNYDFCLTDDKGSLYINGNEFTDNENGVNFEDYNSETLSYLGYLEIKNNIFKNNEGCGVVLPVFDYESPVSVLVEANLFEGNNGGMYLGTNTAVEDSEVLILANYFKDNSEYGVLVFEGGSPSVKIYLNAFTGNEYGLAYAGATPLDARFNWWGSAAGPTVEIYGGLAASGLAGDGDNTTGDIVAMENEGDVRYDPWLAALDLSPAAATVGVNRTHTLTAALRDNQGNLVDLAGLALAIGVAGAHNLDGYETLNAGTVDWGYKGTVPGKDTVSAAVLFVGHGAGLEGAAAVTWESAPPEEGDEGELPKTEGALPWPLFCGALLLAGLCLVLKKAIPVRNR